MTSPATSGGHDRSRREFLKNSTATVLGGTALYLSAAQPVHAAGSDMLRIGLIGCGGRGTGAVRDAMVADSSLKLVAMADAFEDRLASSYNSLAKLLGERVDVPQDRRFVGFDGYKHVLDAGVDLVILATPPGFRPLHFTAAIQAGKHVFMEKPVAVDAPGVRAVLEAGKKAQEKGLAVGVGLQRRHQANYLETVKRIQDGQIGDVVTTRVYWNGAGVWVRPRQSGWTEMEYQMRNWYYFNWLCGDHIVEQHIHNLDVSNWLKNAYPVWAQGAGGREVRTGKEYGEIYDHHTVEFEYADGCRMFSYCRHIPNCWNSVSEHCQGTKGRADISGARLYDLKGKEIWRFSGPNNQPYQQEHADLIASIRSGSPINEAEYGALSSMTAILGRLATYSGKAIRWEDALASNKSLAPKEYDFNAKPPVLPDEQGNYPIAVPGVTEVL